MNVSDCALIGHWRIVASDLWGPDDLDLLGPATIAFDGRGNGDITVGALTAALQLQYARTVVFFRWHGSDDMTEVEGDGSAELLDDGTITIELAYHAGDEAILKAVREPFFNSLLDHTSRSLQDLGGRGWSTTGRACWGQLRGCPETLSGVDGRGGL